MRHSLLALCFSISAFAVPAHAENLLDVYRLAQENDAQLKGAEAARLAVLESKPQSEALLLPTISANANTTANRLDISQPASAAGVTHFNSNGYSLTLTQPVYHRDTYVQLRQADARIAQAEAIYNAAEQELMTRVATAYFDVLAAQDNLVFALAEKKAIGQQLEQSQQRFDVGLVAITDVQETQARYDSAVAQEIDAERRLASAHEAIREITAQPHGGLIPLQAEIPLVTPEPQDIQQWADTALRQNLLISAAQSGAEIALEEIERQRAGHYPSVDIVGNRIFAESGGGRFGGSETLGDTLTLQLNVPLYQGGLINSRTREAHARHSQALAILEQQQRSVLRQTRDAYLSVTANISRVQALRQAVTSNHTALESTRVGLEVGTRTEVDVLDAQRELFRTERDHARARYDYILQTLRLKQAAGTLSPADLAHINTWLHP
ncbi:MAG: TolC family outer membrane protein [Gammaproteobacteria bacterium]|nr:TolC family outer membrane protein [Gammaproteobacteria bacterium]